MKNIIVTGISRGLGKAFFDYLVKKDEVYLIGIGRSFLPYQKKLAEEKREEVNLITYDFSSLEAIENLETKLSNLLCVIKPKEIIFVNNAGTIEPIGKIGKLDNDKLKKSINVNYVFPVLLINTLVGIVQVLDVNLTVINITSGATEEVICGWASYSSSKAGTKMFCDILHCQEQGLEKISVINIDPGVMDTKMQQIIVNTLPGDFPQQKSFQKLQAEGKLQKPEIVAKNILDKYIIL